VPLGDVGPLVRGVVVWLALGTMAVLVQQSAPRPSLAHDHFLPIMFVAAAVALADVVSRDELLFFGNLGGAPRTVVALYLLPAVALEALVTLVLWLI